MFGRGNWAILGIDTESTKDFLAALENQQVMLVNSQLAASALTRIREQDAVGLNPFSMPRLDEQSEVPYEDLEFLARYAWMSKDDRAAITVPEELLCSTGYAYEAGVFQLDPSLPYFGFWVVMNEWKDVNHIASIREQAAINSFERPYKFLDATDKKTVDAAATTKKAAKRNQFAVLLDLNEGRMFVENTNKSSLLCVQNLFQQLGLRFESVCWRFGNSENFTRDILQKIYDERHFAQEFDDFAADASRFTEQEREESDNPELKKLLNDYFSTTQLESELWASLSTPAQVRPHPTFDAIVLPKPVSVTELLKVTEDAGLYGASITFQERIAKTNKQGEERIFRKDIATIDVNDQMNLVDAGAALLRGFDLPAFRRGMMRQIKKDKQVPPLRVFWCNWLVQMSDAVRTIISNFKDVLEIKDEKAGIVPIYGERNDEVIEGE